MNILFVCTHNRCRSILAEAITNHIAPGILHAASAGSTPSGEVHPLSVKHLESRNIPIEGLRSKSWEDIGDFKPDVVITVCDSAANEPCPVWLGNATKVHWGLPDPSRLTGTDQQIDGAFDAVIATIEKRIKQVIEGAPKVTNQAMIDRMKQIEGDR